eukprot:g2554.t1
MKKTMGSHLLSLLLLAGFAAARTGRTVFALDHGWKYTLEGSAPAPLKPCQPADFPTDMTDKVTNGLTEKQAIDEQECATACCSSNGCETYQWCNSSACGYGPPSQGSCWVGAVTGASTTTGKGWFSRARTAPPTPPPTPVPASGCPAAWCRQDTDDSSWRTLSVPHDFVLEGNFTSSADKSHGYLPYGAGLYRKHLALPATHAAQLRARTHTALLQFDGVQAGAQVFLGGQLLGSHTSGYTPFSFELDAAARAALVAASSDKGGVGAAAPLVLAVRADATQPDGWWYDGGGIYRRVRLVVMPLQHIAPHGGSYLPSTVTGAIDKASRTADAELAPSVTAVNADATAAAAVTVTVELRQWEDGSRQGGALVGSAAANATIAAASNTTLALPKIQIPKANLWSDVSPTLYVATTTLTANGVDDVVTHNIGVRKTAWSADKGFELNDVPTKIKGNANHQDFAGIGVAVPDMLQAHRIQKLKDMGSNGWRTAHNPPNEALLDAADRLGFLVWDENHRNGQDDELTRLVLRDRNHPSIVLWSVCNEKLCDTGNTNGDFARMVPLFHSLDPLGGRLVSANYNSIDTADSPLDVLGIDYATSTYDSVHSKAPAKPLISSETSSAVSDRGEYSNDPAGGHVSGYDTEHPGWGQTAEGAWGGVGQPNNQGILTRDFIAGGFTWTGWDYKGEPTPDGWPDINSHFGIIDEAGFPKDRYYWYQSFFPDYPAGKGIVHLLPHWNWAADPATATATHMEPCSATGGSMCTLAPAIGGDCPGGSFTNASGVQCDGLEAMHGGDGSADACAQACCSAAGCLTWQWMSTSNQGGGCWAGTCSDNPYVQAQWVGGSRDHAPMSVKVWAFSNADSVELYLNGRSFGVAGFAAGNMSHFEWPGVPYAPGNLTVVARSVVDGANVTIATDTVLTTGAPAALRASIKDGVGASGLTSGCDDVALVQVEVLDSAGRVVPTAANNVTFSVTGPGSYRGGGNGDPACHVSDLSESRPAYHGLVLGVVQSTRTDETASGSVAVTVSSPGLKSDVITIKAESPTFTSAWWCEREQQL